MSHSIKMLRAPPVRNTKTPPTPQADQNRTETQREEGNMRISTTQSGEMWSVKAIQESSQPSHLHALSPATQLTACKPSALILSTMQNSLGLS